ncbi:MAG: glycosyltransferase family 4 protein [Candidatus Nanopelagicales bacterium]
MTPAPPRIAIVTPVSDVRHATLQIEAARLNGHTAFVVPGGGATSWPLDVERHELKSFGNSHSRQWMVGLGTVLDGIQPDLIHIANEPWAFTTLRALRTGLPVVVHGGESLYREAPLRYRLRRGNTSRRLRQLAGYVNWGTTGLRAAEDAGLPGDVPKAVIPGSPPDPGVFSYQPLRPLGDRLRVVAVGRLVAAKGIDCLLEAAADPSRRQRIDLTVVGDGPYAQNLRTKAAALGLAVRFTGDLDAGSVHEELVKADVLVQPSLSTPSSREQWGRSVVEAMMTGRPVITSDCGELPHLVQDRDCVFPQGDSPALGRALDELMEQRALLTIRAERARRRAEAFRPDVLSHELVALWRAALAYWQRSHETATSP